MRVADAETVSVVIPTHSRPQLVLRAVESALAQTFDNLEVVVVLADDNPETPRALASISDPRLHCLPFNGRLWAPAARNRGIQFARGGWVAMLDDDDTWMPEKLGLQMEVALHSTHALPIVSCGMLACDGQTERRWPRRLPVRGEPIGDYLFCRKGIFGAGGFLQSSTLLAPRRLFVEVPFRDDFQSVDDLDWLLRAIQVPSAGVEFVVEAGKKRPRPLIVWNIERSRQRASSWYNWRVQFDWIVQNRHLVTREALGSYLLTWASRNAARQGAGLSGFRELLQTARRYGRISAVDVAVHLAHFAIPFSILNRISGWFTGRAVKAARDRD